MAMVQWIVGVVGVVGIVAVFIAVARTQLAGKRRDRCERLAGFQPHFRIGAESRLDGRDFISGYPF